MNSDIDSAADLILQLKKEKNYLAYVLTGAGISRASNIPTFRGEDGLWEKYNFNEVATAEAWAKNPIKIWTFYAEGVGVILNAKPNPAHIALAKMEKEGFIDYIITQNADSLHQKAGSKRVLEIHGNITRVKCVKCGKIEQFTEIPNEIPPLCCCGGMLRPDVILYNEILPADLIKRSYQIAKKATLVLVVGTSAEVYPAAGLPFLSKEHGAKVITFNKEQTEHSDIADVFIKGKCEESLPTLIQKLAI